MGRVFGLLVSAWLVAVLAWPASPATAATGPIAGDDAVRARLLTAVDATGSLPSITAGFEVFLGDGWKTYWRSPGDAGLPPQLDWAASENVADVTMEWPAPARFSQFGVETIGYDADTVFPLDVTVATPGQPVLLRATADLLVCSTICVPRTIELALDLPAGPAAIDEGAAASISRGAGRVPVDMAALGLPLPTVETTAEGLRVAFSGNQPALGADVFVEADGRRFFGTPTWSRNGDGWVASVPLEAGADVAGLAGDSVRVTAVDQSFVVEAATVVGGAAAAGSVTTALAGVATADLLRILVLALAGGLILNIMPCVLPVLSLKLASVLGQGGASRASVRRGFLATAAGIVASFLFLAAVLVALQSAGVTVGWGVHFQEPIFIVAMMALVLLFAANLFGAFEIALPGAIGERIDSVPREGLLGHFASGVLATLLATPCSAPFLGTAVGFALAGNPAIVLVVFLTLGIGLALPYLAVAAFPQVAGWLPRPGPWLAWVRPILGVALVATAAWLGWVMALQRGVSMTVVVLAVLAASLALAIWALRRRGTVRRVAGAAAVAAAALALVLPASSGPSVSAMPATATALEARWEPFDEARIPELVANGRVVFLDVTAAWCVTCLANKSFVIDREPVASALAAPDVVLMRADWTLPDPTIAAFLERHGRYGIPFNAVYGPAAPAGLVLSELLTTDAVLAAVGEARTGPLAAARPTIDGDVGR